MIYRQFRSDLKNKNFQYAVESIENLAQDLWQVSNSQSGQDLFVIAMLEGKSHGTFLEIGGSQPRYSNNTYILEKFFQFTGVSIDKYYTQDWAGNNWLPLIERDWALCRPATAWYNTDALTFDYTSLPPYYDYLQVDIDPPSANLEVLQQICNHKKFSVITFEHDAWSPESINIREHSREYLYNLGYVLVADNVGVLNGNRLDPFEDWWAHPEFIDDKIIKAYQCTDLLSTKNWKDIIFRTE